MLPSGCDWFGGRVEEVMSRTKVIGMLGGMSWESSAEYYRLANEIVRARLGGLHSARIVLASVDFAEIERLQAASRWEEAARLLAGIAKELEAAGADLLILCTNTMHKVADQVQAAVSIPLLHLVDVTAAAVISAGMGTIGLLGTAFTMEQVLPVTVCESWYLRRMIVRMCTGSFTTSCARALFERNHARSIAQSSGVLLSPALRGSSLAAPRLSC
jgi:hypothetical protein